MTSTFGTTGRTSSEIQLEFQVSGISVRLGAEAVALRALMVT